MRNQHQNTATFHYSFGMNMQSYSNAEFNYSYGMNTQEKDNEIYGKGNSYSAEFWQYDARLGRRWNVDPVVKTHESPYATFANNPILIIDPNGLDSVLSQNNTWQWEIKANDTYWKISKETGISIDDLREWNSYEDKKLKIGGLINLSDPTTENHNSSIANIGNEGVMFITPIEWYWRSQNPEIGSEVYGPAILLDFWPNSSDAQYGWVQTINTNNVYDGTYSSLKDPLSPTQYIDGSGHYPNEPRLFDSGRMFDDRPARPAHNEGTVFWIGEVSLVRKTEDGWQRIATFQYGFTIYGPNNGSPILLRTASNPSKFHTNTINNVD